MLTPLDISEKEFRRTLRGYSEEEVDNFLDRVVQDYQQLYQENLNLKEKLAESEDKVRRYQGLEEQLNKTLLLAQDTAEQVQKNAQDKAAVIVEEARLEGERRLAAVQEKINALSRKQLELEQQARTYRAKLKASLLSQLHLLEEEDQEQALEG